MKGKQLAIVLVLLVVVGGVALFLNQRNSASWKNTATASNAKIIDFQLNDVSHVTMKEGAAELNLARKDDIWKVAERADFPADFSKVSSLLRKVWELRAVQDVQIGPSQLGRLQLEEPGKETTGGTLLDLKGAGDKRLAGLLFGKKLLRNSDRPPSEGGGVPAGRYVMTQNGSHHVFLVSDMFDEVQIKPEQWLDHNFIKVENPKSIAVTGSSPALTWKVVRDTASGPWKFADAKPGEELDSARSAALPTLLANARFADVLSPDAPVAETGLDKPATIRVETFDNFVYSLQVGKVIGENYPVMVSVTAELAKERKPAADEKEEEKEKLEQEFQARQKQLEEKLAQEQKLEKRPYLMAKTTLDQLLTDRASLVAKKESPTPKPGAPAVTSPSPRPPRK